MVYIGQTKNMKIRDRRHCLDSKTKIDQDIKKYGRDNFLLSVILTSTNKQDIALAEIEWIKQARAKLGHDMVYNVSNGGMLIWLGLKHSDSSREKLRQAHAGMHEGEKNIMFGKEHSIDSKTLMSQNRKGKGAGEQNANSKLTKAQAELIKIDTRSERYLAKLFGVSRSAINNIKRGLNWK
jgi:group I intron endonuclease